ncbi:zinc finger protein 16-like isoform X12 [Liolophura sinensis]|uniref:zinc finger protein 16-like isoform X12 n=1 Tax=Liolophura sinensis TaxID=3198878 RepID=UPI003158DA1C
MGVTLERVQNKFACIIGELCSEPVILSQFAIWVDLRIAEYKAKGAISLDCSGEDPEPGWLNGHRLHRKNESRDRMVARTPVRKSLSRPMGHPSSMHSSPVSLYDQSPASSQVDSDQGFLGETRLSPNLMVIKDEPTDGTASTGVYPTGIHAHGAVTPTRKRPASETVSQADSSFYEQQNTSVHSPSKVQRLSSTGESPHPGDTTSNQSLMSIISGEIDEGNQTAGNLNDRDIDIILDYESKNTFPAQREDNSVSAASRLPEASSSSTADIGDTFSQEGSSNTVTDGEGGGNLVCEDCGQAFSWPQSLKRHRVKHLPSPPSFPCPLCNKAFSRRESLRRHQKVHFQADNGGNELYSC